MAFPSVGSLPGEGGPSEIRGSAKVKGSCSELSPSRTLFPRLQFSSSWLLLLIAKLRSFNDLLSILLGGLFGCWTGYPSLWKQWWRCFCPCILHQLLIQGEPLRETYQRYEDSGRTHVKSKTLLCIPPVCLLMGYINKKILWECLQVPAWNTRGCLHWDLSSWQSSFRVRLQTVYNVYLPFRVVNSSQANWCTTFPALNNMLGFLLLPCIFCPIENS